MVPLHRFLTRTYNAVTADMRLLSQVASVSDAVSPLGQFIVAVVEPCFQEKSSVIIAVNPSLNAYHESGF
jgi:hypothetical protein